MPANFLSALEASPLLRSLYENTRANAILVTDLYGYILHYNHAFCELFGYDADDLIGKHMRILYNQQDIALQVPEREMDKVIQLGSSSDKNYLLHKDGTYTWVSGESIQCTYGEDKFNIKLIQNIHEQKLLEKVLKESNDFAHNVIRSITDAILVFDPDYKILKVNTAFYKLLQINLDTVEGKYIHDLDHPLFSDENFKKNIHQLVSGEEAENFSINWNYDQNEAHVSHFNIKGSFMDGQPASKRILLVISDVTELVQSEQKRDDVIDFVIHELRNPLANVSMCNTLIADAVQANEFEGIAEYIGMSKVNTQRLKTIIEEMYEATKAGSGGLQFTMKPFNLQGLILQVLDPIQLANPAVKFQITGNMDVTVTADRNRIGQVLNNYLLNAIKYSPGANKVEVNITTADNNLVIGITDFGKGIAEHEVPRVFDRYFRAGKTSKAEGLGLGLYLSKQIIDAHGGRVWVKSKENAGSTFYFSLPL